MKRLAVIGLVCVAAACTSPVDTAPLDTSGPVVPTVPASTLHPYEPTPQVADSTIPPGALFGGDLCTALTAADIAAVPLGSFGYGRLFQAWSPSLDSCIYRVLKGKVANTVLLSLIGPDTFGAPPADGETLTQVDAVGDDAVGVVREGSASVMVRVGKGYFRLTAPDLASATELARRAAPRSDHPITTTSTTDPGPLPTDSVVPGTS